MASFTDKQPLKFNQYVQQQPVEAMVQVGMAKQKAHEEGVQKIQTQIDNIAGLDVIRDVDKAHLQSKLNELGNSLRTISAGDFSNFQLVNSAAGMTKQIANDEGIQNAVASAARYRKEVGLMEEARKSGKSSIVNEWVFGKDSSDWLNSTDQKASYNVKYKEYKDVDKKWLEVVKGLHSDLKEQDIPYVTNADGTINYGQTAAAMQRISKEGVSSDKIASALRASLSPDELDQLSMNGRYTYRGVPPEALVDQSTQKYTGLVKKNNEVIRELEGLATLSSSNPAKKRQAEEAIEALKNQNKELQSQYDNEVKNIRTNPEGVKGELYKNAAIAQFSAAHAWEHQKSNLLTNPIKQQENWEKGHALDTAKYHLSVRAQNWNEYSDQVGWKFKEKELSLAEQKANIEKYGVANPFTTYGGLDTKITDPKTAMLNDAKEYKAAADAGVNELMRLNPGVSKTQIENALQKYQAGDPNWFKLGGSSKVILPKHQHEIVNQIYSNRKEANLINSAIARETQKVLDSPEYKAATNQIYEDVKNFKPINVKDRNGRWVRFSQKEVADFARKQLQSEAATGKKPYLSELTPKERLLYSAQQHSQRQTDTSMAQVFKGYFNAAGKQANRMNNFVGSRLDKAIGDLSVDYVPTQEAITFSSEGGGIARRTWENNALLLAGVYERGATEGGARGGTEEFNEDEIKAVKQWVTGEKRDNIHYSMVTQGKKKYLSLTKEGQEILIPVDQRSMDQLPIPFNPRVPTGSERSLTKAQYLGGGNTNPTGDFRNSYYDNTKLPYVNLNVGVDLQWNETNKEMNYIQLKLNTPIGTLPLQIDAPVTRTQAESLIRNLTDKEIIQTYLKQYSSDPSIPKEYIQAIKQLKP